MSGRRSCRGQASHSRTAVMGGQAGRHHHQACRDGLTGRGASAAFSGGGASASGGRMFHTVKTVPPGAGRPGVPSVAEAQHYLGIWLRPAVWCRISFCSWSTIAGGFSSLAGAARTRCKIPDTKGGLQQLCCSHHASWMIYAAESSTIRVPTGGAAREFCGGPGD